MWSSTYSTLGLTVNVINTIDIVCEPVMILSASLCVRGIFLLAGVASI